MTDNNLRKGTRQKKIPRHFQPQQPEYIPFVHPKINESKDRTGVPIDKNLLANVLCRFIQNTNQKYKKYIRQIRAEGFKRTLSSGMQSNVEISAAVSRGGQNLKANNLINWVDRERKQSGSAERVRKAKIQQKPSISENLQRQANLAYNTMLCEHIRNQFPNIADISLNTLNSFELSRRLIENSRFNQPMIIVEKRQQFRVNNSNSFCMNNEEDKPKMFKNQAYHLTIAYYIQSKKQKIALSTTSEKQFQWSMLEPRGSQQMRKEDKELFNTE